MKIYIASFYDTRDRLRPICGLLEEMGHQVTSRWIFLQENDKTVNEEDLASYAQRDIDDIVIADMIICDTIDETPRGGREVELGYAMAIKKKAVTVGPKRNVFHRLIPNFRDWPSLLLVLTREAKKE